MRTVLIVDDDKLLREAIGHDFQRRQYTVVLADSGNQALQILETTKVDVVLSDVRMPNGDGIQLLKKIREQNCEFPVFLLLTGFAELAIEDAYHEGAAAMIAKPFNRKTLYNTIDLALLPKRQRWDHPTTIQLPNLNLRLHYQNFAEAIESRAVSLGQGGMFVSMSEDLPVSIGSEINFTVAFQNSTKENFSGRGILRWLRTQKTANLAKGCGVEFVHIQDDFRDRIIRLTEELNPKSFIPKY